MGIERWEHNRSSPDRLHDRLLVGEHRLPSRLHIVEVDEHSELPQRALGSPIVRMEVKLVLSRDVVPHDGRPFEVCGEIRVTDGIELRTVVGHERLKLDPQTREEMFRSGSS